MLSALDSGILRFFLLLVLPVSRTTYAPLAQSVGSLVFGIVTV